MAKRALTGVFACQLYKYRNSYVVCVKKSDIANECVIHVSTVCREWVEYKNGFGDLYSPDGEFWLGNEPLHYLTSQGVYTLVFGRYIKPNPMVTHETLCLLGNYDLHIDMEDFEGNQRFAEYKNFKVENEKVTLRKEMAFLMCYG